MLSKQMLLTRVIVRPRATVTAEMLSTHAAWLFIMA